MSSSSAPPAISLRDCVAAATMAPSLHNSQPWLFRIGADVVEVRADRKRQLEVLDPAGRELLISVGAALFTLRLAIRGGGHRPHFQLFPDPDDADLVARVARGSPLPATPVVEAMVAAIPHRHTNRWPFARSVVPQDVLDHLRDAARREGAALQVAGPIARTTILGLSEAADRMLQARRGYRGELARWTLPSQRRRDGVPPTAIGPWHALETMPIRDFGLLQPQLRRTAEQFEPHPTIAILSTDGDGNRDWVTAGQALQRVLLMATWLNLASTPISQPVEIPMARELLTDLPGRHAQIVLRLGYGRPAATTARRPLDDVLLP